MNSKGPLKSRTVLLFVVAVVICFAAGRWPTAKNFNDADLLPSPMQVSSENNAFLTLAKTTNDLYWPETLEDRLNDLSNDSNWDDSLANDVLQKNRACLAWFEQTLQGQGLVLPAPAAFDEERPCLHSLKTISEVACIQVAKLFHEQKEKEAFDFALKVVEFGHRLENSGGDVMQYLLGSVIKSAGLRHIRQMTAVTTLSEPALVAVIRSLDDLGANQAGLTNALKVEYQATSKSLDEFVAGKFESLGITNSQSHQVAASNEFRRVFSIDKTRAKYARTTRALLKNIPEPFSETTWPEHSQARTVGLAWLQWAVARKHNAYGDKFFYMHLPTMKRLFERKSSENVNVRATQLLLALRIFTTRHGHLPASLQELTPEFFPRVPVDDYDGKPLRYLPEKKLLYSIGPDLKDSGGQRSRKDGDLPFEIPPVAKAVVKP